MSFDVCTRTWQRQGWAPWAHSTWGWPAVVYDPGTDTVLALTVSQTRPTLVSRYSSATSLWTEATEPQTLLPWAYSVDSDRWALLPSLEFPPGFETAAPTHAVLDPMSGEVLFLMEDAGSRTLWSYSPGWRTLTQVGGPVPAGRSGDPTLLLDTRARRLMLILWGSVLGIPGETWTFDLFTQRWTDQQAEPPVLTWEESLERPDAGGGATFDPESHRAFVLTGGGQLSTYRIGDDRWDEVPSQPGWPQVGTRSGEHGDEWTGPLARTGHSLVYDPVTQRILLFGGTWTSGTGALRAGDVWAYDVPTNAWTELVRSTSP
jgi:hypothetical protein